MGFKAIVASSLSVGFNALIIGAINYYYEYT